MHRHKARPRVLRVFVRLVDLIHTLDVRRPLQVDGRRARLTTSVKLDLSVAISKHGNQSKPDYSTRAGRRERRKWGSLGVGIHADMHPGGGRLGSLGRAWLARTHACARAVA